eukprot:6461046-Amphidinium_carterae.1
MSTFEACVGESVGWEAFVEEASKQSKDVPETSERDRLASLTGKSIADFSNPFLQNVGAASSTDAQTLPGAEQDVKDKDKDEEKKKRLCVEDEAPKMYGKLRKELPTIQKNVGDALTKVNKVPLLVRLTPALL